MDKASSESPPKVASSPSRSAWGSSSSSSRPCSQPPTSSSDFPPLSSSQSQQKPPPSRGGWSRTSSQVTGSAKIFNPYPSRVQVLKERFFRDSRVEGGRAGSSSRSDGLPPPSTLTSDERGGEDVVEEEEGLEETRSKMGKASFSSISIRDLTRTQTSFSSSSSDGRRGGVTSRTATLAFGGDPSDLIKEYDQDLGGFHMGPRIYGRSGRDWYKRGKSGSEGGEGSQRLGTDSRYADPSSKPQEFFEKRVGKDRGGSEDDQDEFRFDPPDGWDQSQTLSLHAFRERVNRLARVGFLNSLGPRSDRSIGDQGESGEGRDDGLEGLESLLEGCFGSFAGKVGDDEAGERRGLIDLLLELGMAGDAQDVEDGINSKIATRCRSAVLRGLGSCLSRIKARTMGPCKVGWQEADIECLTILLRLPHLYLQRGSSLEKEEEVARGLDELERRLSSSVLCLCLELISKLGPGSIEEGRLVRSLCKRSPPFDERWLDLGEIVTKLVARVGHMVVTSRLSTSSTGGIGSSPVISPSRSVEKLVRIYADALLAIYRVNLRESYLEDSVFYSTLIDTTPFLNDYVLWISRGRRPGSLGAGKEGEEDDEEQEEDRSSPILNLCDYPFLLSLGAKARILAFESDRRRMELERNPLRYSYDPDERRGDPSGVGGLSGGLASPHLNIRVTRSNLLMDSLGSLLSRENSVELQRPLRVEFLGEEASDGGGPTREWFGSVGKALISYDQRFEEGGVENGSSPTTTLFQLPLTNDSGAWFSPQPNVFGLGEQEEEKVGGKQEVRERARMFGILLGLCVLNGVSMPLPPYLRPPKLLFDLLIRGKGRRLLMRDRQGWSSWSSSFKDELTLEDLESVDPVLARGLRNLLDWPKGGEEDVGGGEVEDEGEKGRKFEETFGLDWTFTFATESNPRGEVSVIDLVPGGKHKAVTLENRERYVSSVIRAKLVEGCKSLVEPFLDGWESVMPSPHEIGQGERKAARTRDEGPSGGRERVKRKLEFLGAVDLVSPNELMRICLGEEDPQDPPSDPSSSFPSQQIRTGLDLSSLRLYTRHENFGQDGRGGEERDPLKSWFWETWESMSPLHQRRLLTFVTGSDRFPLSGAKGVGMVITKVDLDGVFERDVHHHHHLPLPRSSTCTCTLYLPSYPDRMVTSAKLEKVVELAYQGFGLK